MKLWVDDVREAPNGYIWCKSVNQAKEQITLNGVPEIVDFDHDAGDYASDGGDFIRLMDWMEENNISCSVRIHTMNPVGRQKMITIARRNNWKIV